MSLRLEYPDKYRLWSDLIQGNTDRVFLPTDDAQKISSRVPVELSLPSLNVHLVIVGTVVGIRRRSERFPAGAYVRFPDEEIDKCRRFLGLVQSPDRYEQGRKSRRAGCSLRVVFKRPAMTEPCFARDISETGLSVACPADLHAGQLTELELTLDDDSPLAVHAEVIRARDEMHLTGLRFFDLQPEAARKVELCIDRLVSRAQEPQTQSIVVADDDPIILEFLSRALTKHGYEVHTARRGEEALSMIRELRPKLVVLDILMPGVDGVDICKMMRADVDLAEIPVIFMSALEPGRLHTVSDEAGATDYLAKPVELNDLLRVVGGALKI